MAPYKLKEGTEKYYSYKFKEEIAERCLETLRKYAPNMTRENILWTVTHTPLDIENRFLDMVQGSIKQGAYEPLQLGFLRPNEDCSNHRTPIKNLYLGGAIAIPAAWQTLDRATSSPIVSPRTSA